MNSLITCLQNFHDDEAGASATEYIVLLILVACFIILVVKQFGQTISEKFGWADERVTKFVVF
jgi:Flp pilus assembly pilin Flp